MIQFRSVFFFCLFFPAIIFSQENKESKVLFVGNSFTYMWNMPQMVQAMAKTQGINLKTVQSTVGGSNLKQHWKGKKKTQTRKLLKESKWDYVVLQGYSSGTIEAPDRFKEYGIKLINLIKGKKAKPLLFMTWAYVYNPLMQKTIESSYLELGQETNTGVVPVGKMFMQVQKKKPDLKMYFDKKHPSSAGSYLIALIFYKYLTGRTVLDIPNWLTILDSNNNKTYLNFVPPDTGVFLREFVERNDYDSLETHS